MELSKYPLRVTFVIFQRGRRCDCPGCPVAVRVPVRAGADGMQESRHHVRAESPSPLPSRQLSTGTTSLCCDRPHWPLLCVQTECKGKAVFIQVSIRFYESRRSMFQSPVWQVYVALYGGDGISQTRELFVPGCTLFRRNSRDTFVLR